MGDDYITFTQINDFLFSPASLYLHASFYDKAANLYKEKAQIAGSIEHEAIEEGRYSSKKNIIQAKTVYCEKYNLLGKIDIFNIETGELVERKNKIKSLHLGYIYQAWAQYFALREYGFKVCKIFIYSKQDNKKYEIKIPDKKDEEKFALLIKHIREFKAENLLNVSSDNKATKSIYGTLSW